MRKILISVLIVLIVVIFGLMAVSGLNIGNLRIASVKEIIDENKKLDESIETLNKTITTDYVTAKSNLDASLKKLETSKQKYQDTIRYSTEEEIKAANQTESYEIGYLWTKIGLYATKRGIVMQANVSSGSITNLYNITFTITGEYISISEFIYDIENDSNLGFKIEDFTLSPGTGNNLQGTFIIRNVAIDRESLSAAAKISTEQSSDLKDTQGGTNNGKVNN